MPRQLAMPLLLFATAMAPADAPIAIAPVQAGEASPAADAPSAQPLNAAQPTSVVDRAALDQFVAPTGNYDDAIRLTPSVVDVAPNGPGLGEAQTLTIRGFADGQYNVAFDGIPFADSDDFTHHSSAYFVARDLSGVSVDRGPGDATTLGDATFGGTVALRSIGSRAAGGVSPAVSLGSFNTGLGGLLLDSGRGGLPGRASALLDVTGVQSDGALDHAAQRRANLFAKAVVPLGDNARLTVVSNAASTVQGEPLGATRAEIAADGPSVALDDDPRSQAFEGYNSSTYHTDFSYADLTLTPADGMTLSNKLYSYGLYRRIEQGLDPNGETPNGTALAPGDVPGQSGRNGLRAWGDMLRATHPLPDGLTVEAGAWVERQTNSRFLLQTDRTLGDGLDPVLTPVAGVPSSTSIDRLQRETLVTAQPYAQLDWQALPALRLTGGVKGALFDRSVDATVMEGTRLSAKFERDFAAALPSATAQLSLAPGWRLYGQAAEGFLAPALQLFDVTDPAGAAVQPERTWNFQLGTSWRSPGLAAAVDGYDIVVNNAIGTRTVGGQSVDFDEGGVVYRGLEAEATQALRLGVALYGSGSLNQSRQSRGNGAPGGSAPATPQATLSSGLLYDRNAITASMIDRWVGGSYGDVGRTQWIAPFNQLDLSIGMVIKRMTLRAQLFNLLDSRKVDGLAGYTVAAGTPLFWTQAGRSVFFSATAWF